MIEICSEKAHLIPPSDSISTEKLSHGGTITTDTCNGAQKLRCIIVEKVGGMFEFDCMNHLCNVWFGVVIKKLGLGQYLEDLSCNDLEEIHHSPHVGTYTQTSDNSFM